MTLDEAKLIAGICATADSGCPSCVGGMAGLLQKFFPAYAWVFVRERTYQTVFQDGEELGLGIEVTARTTFPPDEECPE